MPGINLLFCTKNNKKNKGKKDNTDDVNKLKNENKNVVQENSYLKKQIEEFEKKETKRDKHLYENVETKEDEKVEISNDKKSSKKKK